MTYVMANLHGALEQYRRMLEKIGFSKQDVLYVLGDTADYGEDAVALLTELSMCENVYSVAGEHDYTALRMLAGFDRMLKSGAAPDPAFAQEMMAWAADGGKATLDGFRALDEDMREGLLDYLSEATLFEEIEVGGTAYVLAHGGIADFETDRPLEDYEPEAFFAETPLDTRLFADRVLVVGHVPTESGRIERREGLVRIDCGVKDGGSLGCLCLETGEEFYV